MNIFRGLLILACAGSLSACWHKGDSGAGAIVTPKAQLAATHFAGCDDYRNYFSASLSRELLEGWAPCWGCEFFATDGAPEIAAGAPGGPPQSADADSGFRDVSDTNTQEAGVDEADIIKADVRGYFYIARGRELLVVRATPADSMEVVARLELQAGDYSQVRDLYFDAPAKRLVALLDGAAHDYPASAAPARYGSAALFLDVDNPLAPVATDWQWTEGYRMDSRRVDSRLHMVSRHHFWWPAALSESEEFHQRLQSYRQARYAGREDDATQLAAQIRSEVDAAVQAAPLRELLPLHKSGLGAGEPQPLACTAVLHAEVEHRMAMLLITSVNTDGSQAARLATINNAWQLYASRDYLYLAQNSGGWWFDQRQAQQTAIYRFRLTNSAVQPAGYGLVDGWTRDAYSFGEDDGYLRVATTQGRPATDGSGWTTTNHLFVLGAGGDSGLQQVGAVRDFIRDERIFSSRFLGKRGFVVTFRQVDPLFAFDLSNPRAPVLRGQLEIPGFSTYIHPLGENHLLTIGRDGDANGVNNNIRLQIFDVSDLAHPTLAHFYVPEVDKDDWVFSLAEHDPHAFTYYAPDKLLSIPLQIGSPDASRSFSGFLALGVDVLSGFTERGRIDHKSDDEGGSGCPPDRDTDGAPCQTFAPVYYNVPLRSVVGVDDERTILYTLSSATLNSADAAVLSEDLDSLDLAPP